MPNEAAAGGVWRSLGIWSHNFNDTSQTPDSKVKEWGFTLESSLTLHRIWGRKNLLLRLLPTTTAKELALRWVQYSINKSSWMSFKLQRNWFIWQRVQFTGIFFFVCCCVRHPPSSGMQNLSPFWYATSTWGNSFNEIILVSETTRRWKAFKCYYWISSHAMRSSPSSSPSPRPPRNYTLIQWTNSHRDQSADQWG